MAENIPGKRKTSYRNCAKFHDPNVVSFFLLFFSPSILMDEVEVGLLFSFFKSKKLLELGAANVLG